MKKIVENLKNEKISCCESRIRVKIVLLGMQDSGKSSLTCTFFRGVSKARGRAKNDSFYYHRYFVRNESNEEVPRRRGFGMETKSLMQKGIVFDVSICDFDRYHKRKLYYEDCDVFLFLFDSRDNEISDFSSFHRQIVEKIGNERKYDLFFVGTHKDDVLIKSQSFTAIKSLLPQIVKERVVLYRKISNFKKKQVNSLIQKCCEHKLEKISNKIVKSCRNVDSQMVVKCIKELQQEEIKFLKEKRQSMKNIFVKLPYDTIKIILHEFFIMEASSFSQHRGENLMIIDYFSEKMEKKIILEYFGYFPEERKVFQVFYCIKARNKNMPSNNVLNPIYKVFPLKKKYFSFFNEEIEIYDFRKNFKKVRSLRTDGYKFANWMAGNKKYDLSEIRNLSLYDVKDRTMKHVNNSKNIVHLNLEGTVHGKRDLAKNDRVKYFEIRMIQKVPFSFKSYENIIFLKLDVRALTEDQCFNIVDLCFLKKIYLNKTKIPEEFFRIFTKNHVEKIGLFRVKIQNVHTLKKVKIKNELSKLSYFYVDDVESVIDKEFVEVLKGKKGITYFVKDKNKIRKSDGNEEKTDFDEFK